MCKGAVVPVLALADFVRKAMAELSLVLVLMVKPFYPVMRPPALISFGAFFSIRELAQLRSVHVVIPSLVFN
jgi:hypothetical protein